MFAPILLLLALLTKALFFMATLLYALFLFFADSTGVPPLVVDIVTLVVGVGVAIALKISPIPSRVVGAIGVLAGLVAHFGPGLATLFPASSHVPAIIVIIGFVLVSVSERIQGGVTVPEKRSAAAQGEM